VSVILIVSASERTVLSIFMLLIMLRIVFFSGKTFIQLLTARIITKQILKELERHHVGLVSFVEIRTVISNI
jgi:hypothetical protein